MFIKVHRVMCFFVTALLILLQITCQNDVEKEFLCKNEECSESINEFLVTTNYLPDSNKKIPANKGEKGTILAKPKEKTTTALYKVKIKDSTGFLPSQYIKELSRGEANILVNLTIPVNTVLKSDSTASSTPNPGIDGKKSSAIGDPAVTKIPADDTNSTSIPTVETSRDDSISSLDDNSSSKVKNAANEKENSLEKNSTENKVTSKPSSNDQTKNDTKSDNLKNEYIGNLPTDKKMQNKIIDVSVSVRLENTSLETNESETVSAVKDSENISGSSSNVNFNESEIITPEIRSETENVGEVVEINVVNSLNIVNDGTLKLENISLEANESETVSAVKDSENISGSPSNVNLNESEIITPEIRSETENVGEVVETNTVNSSNIVNDDAPIHNILSSSGIGLNNMKIENDSSTSTNSFKNISKGFSVEDKTVSSIPAKVETPNNLKETFKQSSESTKIVNVKSSPDKTDVTPESKLPNLSGASQSYSATSKVPNDFDADITQTSDNPKTDSVSSAVKKVESENVANVTPEVQILSDPSKMRIFPEKKEPPINLKKPKTLPDDIAVSTDPDHENITSEKTDSSTNDTLLLVSSNAKNEKIIDVNQSQSSVTPEAYPNKVPPPAYIETTTQPIDTVIPNSSKETTNSSEFIPIELSPGTTESSVAEETPSYTHSEPYKYHQPKPYPSLFPKTATENQPPDAAEKSDQVSTQEIDESEPEISSEQLAALSEPASVPLDVDRNQGLSGYIHTFRKQANENEPQSIPESETSEEKSVYETIVAFLPDLNGISWSFIETTRIFFQFGSSSQQEALESEICSAEQFCGTDRLNSHMVKAENIVEIPLLGVVQKEQITFVSGILTAVCFATILLWWLMNYFNKNRKVNLLISRINQLENKLLISTKEIASLQNKLDENDSQAEAKQNVADIKRITEVYEHKINQYKKRIVELDDKVLYLEKELENVSNSALEMHKLLENSLATQVLSKTALDEVETLRSLTESQENQIDDLKKEINAVVTENQCLKVDNEINKSTIKKLEKECNAQTKKNVGLSEKNRDLTLQLDKELENSNALENNYKSEIYELRSKLEDVEMNLKRSEFQVQELQRVVLDKQDSVPSSKNDVQLKIQISTLEAMNNELSGQLNEQKNARRMLEDHVGDVTKELNNLKKSFENSEKERNQAVTKLQVLTQYFKDKEEQLHKELEAKDKLSLERESKDQSLSQKLALMREEINNLKIQNEALQKEVQDQEASYKVQVANAEQKAREHWFEFRQADRKYKECQQEAAILRNKILVLETNMSSISHKADDKNNSGLNGEVSGVSPILYHPSLSPELLPYPSPSDFVPPPPSPLPSHMPDFFPPEPIYSPDERLPPLGGRRAPSPPPPLSPDDEFGPPPPLMKFPSGRNHNVEPSHSAGYSRRTPPPPSSRHRSQFRPRQPRSSIDSPSSGMSLESLDKSGR